MRQETKNCQNCKNSFTIEPEDFDFYKKIAVPPPTFCPNCREQRRIAFRNERALYKRTCGLCKKDIVSRVSPDKPYPAYCVSCWWGDGWDPMQYGRDYDFSRPFFEQFNELLNAVPHMALGASNNVNSEWVNQETDDKNCYLNVGGHENEDSAYNTYELFGKDSFDNFWLLHSELCYENIICERCYRTLYSRECFDCRDTIFSLDCRNCTNIIGCAGLRNKQYHIFNKPVSKEEYAAFLKDHPLSSRREVAALQKRAHETWQSIPRRDCMILKSVNSSGHQIIESKNAHNIWTGEKMEDCKHFFIAAGIKNSYDGTSYGWGELSYEVAHTVGVYNSKFIAYSFGGGAGAETRQASDIQYCFMTGSSMNCFGCVGVRKKEYCILNKQYAKEEYEKLVPEIIAQMSEMPYQGKNGRTYRYGEFFPIELSPFGYNETAAMDYFPLTRADALAKGYPWSDYKAESKYSFSDYEIPDDIRDVPDDIGDKVLKCEKSGKAYRITPMELSFYRRMGIPIPLRAPLERHNDRMAKLLPRILFDRTCECGGDVVAKNRYSNTARHEHGSRPCGKAIKTPYAPDRQEIIYCEQCYNAEVA